MASGSICGCIFSRRTSGLAHGEQSFQVAVNATFFQSSTIGGGGEGASFDGGRVTRKPAMKRPASQMQEAEAWTITSWSTHMKFLLQMCAAAKCESWLCGCSRLCK